MKSILPIAVLMLLTACHSSSIQNENDEVNDTTPIKLVRSPNSINSPTSIRDGQLNAIYQHYSKLTTALIESKPGEAKIESNAIEAGAEQLKGGSSLARSAHTITSGSTIQDQRFAYSKLSTELITLLKKSGMSKGSLYVDFCPMAFNDEGAFWVSNNKEIRNPYLGPGMITCGQVKETISSD